jgi:hypothetical protein
METAPEQSDYLQTFFLVLCFVQMMAMGPKFHGLFIIVEKAFALSILQLDYYTDVTDGVYYRILIGYFVVALGIMLIALYYWRCIEGLIILDDGFVSGVKSVIDSVSPIFIWYGLGCMMAIMTDVFSCPDSYDGDTYLRIDCKSTCWTSEHFAYMFSTIPLLIFGIITGIETRIYWQMF